MNYDDEIVSTGFEKLSEPRRSHPWFLIGGLALALMLAIVGVGAFLGSTTHAAQAKALTPNNTQAFSFAQGNSNDAQTLVVTSGNDRNNSQIFAAGPGAGGQNQGPCEMLTVSSVNGATIVGKTSSCSSVTIHTTASTVYRQAGTTVTASSIKVGTRIDVMGTHNSDGSITATTIDIGR